MKKSKAIRVGSAGKGKSVKVTFTHTDNSAVIAEVSVDTVVGSIRLIRKTENDWVFLDDTLDRNALHENCRKAFELQVDIEKVYLKYTVDLFVT